MGPSMLKTIADENVTELSIIYGIIMRIYYAINNAGYIIQCDVHVYM